MTKELKKQDEVVREDNLPRYRQPADILEREDGFHIFMDVPGVSKEELAIDLNENELVVSGRSCPEPAEGEKFIEVEFGGCEYRRAFKLSNTVDREGIKAHVNNGVLELHLPKAQKAQPKRIEIKAG